MIHNILAVAALGAGELAEGFVYLYPNPDIENTIIAQPLSTSSKSKKCLTTNKVATCFLDSLYVPSDCTLIRVSIPGFGLYIGMKISS